MSISISGPTGITVETDPLALKLTGGTLSGKLTGTATASSAALSVGTLTANPSTLANGDIWIIDRLNFVNRLGNIIGVVTTNQVNTISTSSAVAAILTVNQDGNGGALRVINKGTGNSLLVEDSSPDGSPFVIDADGNVGIGTTGTSAGYKLTVVGQTFLGGNVLVNGSLSSNSVQVAGLDVRTYVNNELFSGNNVHSQVIDLSQSFTYTDSDNNSYWTGSLDANNNEIPLAYYGYFYRTVNWNGSSFVSNDSAHTYLPSGPSPLLTFQVAGGGGYTVNVYSDGTGGITFYPPSN